MVTEIQEPIYFNKNTLTVAYLHLHEWNANKTGNDVIPNWTCLPKSSNILTTYDHSSLTPHVALKGYEGCKTHVHRKMIAWPGKLQNSL